jgi:cysteinyl-tRNA synthetase
LAAIFELVNRTNKNIDDLDFIYNAQETLNELLKILGISLKNMLARYSSVENEIVALISEREKARKDKDYALSDQIRKKLDEKGIVLEDTKDGRTIWRRKL